MHAGKLRGVEAGKRHQRLRLHRVLLVRHGRRTAAAREFDFGSAQRHQSDILAELAEAAGHQRQPAAEIGERIALALPLRRIGKAEPGGKGRAHRRPLVAELFERTGGTAELHDQQAPRLFRQSFLVPLQRRPPRSYAIRHFDRDRRLHARHPGQRPAPEALIERSEPYDGLGQQQAEMLDDGFQPKHQAGVDDILAGRAEMHFLAMRLADRHPDLAHEFRHHDPVPGNRGPQQGGVRPERG